MPLSLDQFMDALSGQESGGNYSARNSRTGASGRWQIMPANWPSWSAEAGIPGADPNDPAAQDAVARYKLQQYYNKFGNWADVASAWYSGQPLSAFTTEQANRKQGAGDEPSIKEYVDSVLNRAGGQTVGPKIGRTINYSKEAPMPDPKKNKPYGPASSAGVFGGPSTSGYTPGPTYTKPRDSNSLTSQSGAGLAAPTGNFDTDYKTFFQAGLTAHNKLIQYAMDKGLIPIIQGGVTYWTNPNELDDSGEPALDSEAMRLQTEEDYYTEYINRLDEGRKAGVYRSADDSAKAYLDSERDKVEDANKAYTDYTQRVNDLVALENIPVARQMAVAQALNAVNTANKSRENRTDTLMTLDTPVQTNTQPFAESVRGTIPSQAPSPYQIGSAPAAQTAPPVSRFPTGGVGISPDLDPGQMNGQSPGPLAQSQPMQVPQFPIFPDPMEATQPGITKYTDPVRAFFGGR